MAAIERSDAAVRKAIASRESNTFDSSRSSYKGDQRRPPPDQIGFLTVNSQLLPGHCSMRGDCLREGSIISQPPDRYPIKAYRYWSAAHCQSAEDGSGRSWWEWRCIREGDNGGGSSDKASDGKHEGGFEQGECPK